MNHLVLFYLLNYNNHHFKFVQFINKYTNVIVKLERKRIPDHIRSLDSTTQK